MARKNDGACANPKRIRTDVDCRAARPKFDKGAWSPAKISDVTDGWLYLLVTPDVSRPGNAASKLWRMSRQALAILRSVHKPTGHRRYAFSCSKDAPLSNNTLNKRLRLLGIDTKTDHCAHGRTTFSTLSHHEEIKDAKA